MNAAVKKACKDTIAALDKSVAKMVRADYAAVLENLISDLEAREMAVKEEIEDEEDDEEEDDSWVEDEDDENEEDELDDE